MASSVKRSLGAELTDTIKKSRVLMVGAGGIGCELLKNLVMTGFGEVHIVDLDTIDLSNLNRQFLFRHEHIKQSKALVAKEAALKFRPSAKLEAYHANITEKRFNVEWFKSFDIVFNALDNLAARRHVNFMCLSAAVPLIESGTTGFNGQVQVIEKGKTECYDCNPKETPKSFAICTIRTTPSQPIHCIVWGKSYLLPELFGTSEDSPDELDSAETADNAKELEELQKEARALKEIRNSMGSDEFPRKVFQKVFKDDIERLRSMSEMWKERSPPEPLDYDKLEDESSSVDPEICEIDLRNWTPQEAFVVFKDSLNRLSKRLKKLQETSPPVPPPILTFDKDDVDTLDFVAATAILRGAIFGIESSTKFDIKQMAGNIIPAIATTNAMTAGLCVLQAFKVLQDDLANAKMVFLERSGARALNSDSLNPPKPDCPVCSAVHAEVNVDANNATLGDIVEGILRSELGYGEEIAINRGSEIIYDPDLEDNLCLKLSQMGLDNGVSITVKDEDDEDKSPRVDLQLHIVTRIDATANESKPVVLTRPLEIPRKPRQRPEPTSDEMHLTSGSTAIGKRKRENEDDLPAAKKAAGAVANGQNNEPIVLDDDDGVFVIE